MARGVSAARVLDVPPVRAGGFGAHLLRNKVRCRPFKAGGEALSTPTLAPRLTLAAARSLISIDDRPRQPLKRRARLLALTRARRGAFAALPGDTAVKGEDQRALDSAGTAPAPPARLRHRRPSRARPLLPRAPTDRWKQVVASEPRRCACSARWYAREGATERCGSLPPFAGRGGSLSFGCGAREDFGQSATPGRCLTRRRQTCRSRSDLMPTSRR